MDTLSIGGHHWLRRDAAESYLRARADGCPWGVTDAGRTNAEQWAMWNRYLRGELDATAAYPGTSKHESGRALDLPGSARAWMRAHGHRYGWMKDRVANEPWHFEYESWRDVVLVERRTTTGGQLPTVPDLTRPTPLEEDDMFTDADRDRLAAVEIKLNRATHLYTFFDTADGRRGVACTQAPFWMLEDAPGDRDRFRDALVLRGQWVRWTDTTGKHHGTVLHWGEHLANAGRTAAQANADIVQDPRAAFGHQLPWSALTT